MSLRARLAKYAHDLNTLPEDATLAYRRGGLKELWEAVAERSLHRLIRWGRVLVIVQRLDEFREVAPPKGITIRRATEADVSSLVEIMSRREADRFRDHVARGLICFVAWEGDRPVGYAWNADRFTSDMTATACPLALPPTASYLWNLYVTPRRRGHGVGPALASARLQLARERGLREGWTMVAATNYGSLRAVGKTAGPNTRIIGELRYLKLLTRVYGQFRPSDTSLSSIDLGAAPSPVAAISHEA
jgi:ribosomal protein S18 acetylase RimI-like enzyme